MKQVHLWISGFVQGVGYRAHTRREARKRGLTGWVTNLADRRVEAVIQGPEDKLKEMITLAKNGSYFAQVQNVVVEWEEITEKFEDFQVIK